MFSTDMKLPIWFAIVISIVGGGFAIVNFGVLSVIILSAALWLLFYFGLGFLKRKGAFTIENDKMIVKSPFKTKEFDVSKFSKIFIGGNDANSLKGKYMSNNRVETITICNSIYTASLDEILQYLIENYPHLTEDSSTNLI